MIDPNDIKEIYIHAKQNHIFRYNFNNYDNNFKNGIDTNGDIIYFEQNNKKFNLIEGKPIAYWFNNKLFDIFKDSKNIGDVATPRTGMMTGDNKQFIRLWWEVNYNNIFLNCIDNEQAKSSKLKWFPYNKGGNYRKWYGNNDYVINYYNGGQEIFDFAEKDDRNVQNYPDSYKFKPAISWSLVSSVKPSFRYKNNNLSDIGGPSLYTTDNDIYNILALCNSTAGSKILTLLAPTINFQGGDIARIPLATLDTTISSNITNLSKKCIEISKQDWDKREYSWDFKKLFCTDDVNTLSEFYERYKNNTNTLFTELKDLELQINDIFSKIYCLADDEDTNILDSDITIEKVVDNLKSASEDEKNNIYLMTKEDIIKDLISYIVGCAFGRYSPYKDGLVFAGGEFNYDKYLEITKSLEQPLTHNGLQNYAKSFMPSEENCIMITDNEYGKNDMTSYVVDFITKIYGREHLQENLKFIANALDEKSTDIPANVIRDYLANDFYKDHCKKYQNRPIYWQLDSGKNGGFRALMYLHRYDQNTIPTARLSYLHDIQWKYEQEKERLEKYIENSTIASEKTKAKRQLDLINKQILECRAYDEVLNHASNMNITLDLDDGVKVNYQKMQKLDGDKDKNILSTYLKF